MSSPAAPLAVSQATRLLLSLTREMHSPHRGSDAVQPQHKGRSSTAASAFAPGIAPVGPLVEGVLHTDSHTGFPL